MATSRENRLMNIKNQPRWINLEHVWMRKDGHKYFSKNSVASCLKDEHSPPDAAG